MTSATTGSVAMSATAKGNQRYFRRFTPIERVLHALLMLTFVGCALSGLPLLFSNKPWAATLAKMLGGFQGAGLIHRICAFVMIVWPSAVTAAMTAFSVAVTEASSRKMSLPCSTPTRHWPSQT